MYRIRDIKAIANRLAPENIALDWDNSGLQIGDLNNMVNSILLTLDINEKVIDEAIRLDCQLIISHHPMLFKPVKRISEDNYIGRLIYKAIRNNIGIFSMHTNLDLVENGINDYLANLLGLKDIEYLEIVKEVPSLDMNEYGLGRIGFLGEKISFKGFIDIIRDRFSITQLRYVGDESDYLNCVALCSGSGADLIEIAAQKGADVLLTADIKYHQAQYAEQLGINLVDAGHYQTEHYVKTLLYDYFVSKLTGVKIFKSELNTDPWKYD